MKQVIITSLLILALIPVASAQTLTSIIVDVEPLVNIKAQTIGYSFNLAGGDFGTETKGPCAYTKKDKAKITGSSINIRECKDGSVYVYLVSYKPECPNCTFEGYFVDFSYQVLYNSDASVYRIYTGSAYPQLGKFTYSGGSIQTGSEFYLRTWNTNFMDQVITIIPEAGALKIQWALD